MGLNVPVYDPHARTAKPKPSRFSRDLKQHEKRTVKAKAKRVADAADDAAWEALKEIVWKRDEGRCRICGKTARLHATNPKQQGTAHHIVYRSAGGSDDLSNLLWICRPCHADEHEHRLRISGTAAKPVVEVVNPETGRLRSRHGDEPKEHD